MERINDYEILSHLLEQAKKGDVKSFEEIYKKTKTAQYFLTLKHVRDESLAEDVVQETFVKLYRYLNRIENAMSLLSYLKKINYSISMKELKKQSKEPKHSIDLIAESELSPEESNSGIKNEKVKKTLTKMQPEHRDMIKLKYIDCLKIREISKIKNVSEKTVSRRLHDAKEEFKVIYLIE